MARVRRPASCFFMRGPKLLGEDAAAKKKGAKVSEKGGKGRCVCKGKSQEMEVVAGRQSAACWARKQCVRVSWCLMVKYR